MSSRSRIEWTETTWNPTTGCDRISAGCDHCYALTLAKRLKAMGSVKYQKDGDLRTSGPGFGITEHPDALDVPLRWRKPRRVFVNSMSDLFHDGISDEFIERVFASMAMAGQHTYQVLTKRHGRMRSLLNSPTFEQNVRLRVEHHDEVYTRTIANWPLPNVWLGVTVENQRWADIRIPALLDTPAAVRFLSCEPLLGPVDLSGWTDTPLVCGCGGEPGGLTFGCCAACMLHEPSGLDWVICGGESGPDARPARAEWFTDLRDRCVTSGVPFFFKQWGGRTPKAGGRELEGRTWNEMPNRVEES